MEDLIVLGGGSISSTNPKLYLKRFSYLSVGFVVKSPT